MDVRRVAADCGADRSATKGRVEQPVRNTLLVLVNASDRMPVMRHYRWLLCAGYQRGLREVIGDFNSWPAARSRRRTNGIAISQAWAPLRSGKNISRRNAIGNLLSGWGFEHVKAHGRGGCYCPRSVQEGWPEKP
jgi:hypothetical protein